MRASAEPLAIVEIRLSRSLSAKAREGRTLVRRIVHHSPFVRTCERYRSPFLVPRTHDCTRPKCISSVVGGTCAGRLAIAMCFASSSLPAAMRTAQ